MIIARTPLRISFVGGGTDLSAFYQREAGAVVSTAINKYIYITVNRKFDHRIRASYSVTEMVDTIDQIQHQLIREALKLVGQKSGIEITSISDIPSEGTGLGSSSSYTVGLLNALYAYRGHHAEAERLAREACEIEIIRCGKPIGKQDQYIAAYGNLQYLRFNPDETVYVDPIVCEWDVKKKLENNLLLLYTGLVRSADEILREQEKNSREDHLTQASLRKLTQLAAQMQRALCEGAVDCFGELLHEGWMEKRKLAEQITNSKIDNWYERARRHGAIGGKLLGAGGGGFLLLYAPTQQHEEIIAALPELRHVPFRFEPQGSKIIFVEENR